MPAVRRVQYLRALQSGMTIGGDETLVLRILRASPADLVTVVDGADAWDLMYALDRGNAASLREILRTRTTARPPPTPRCGSRAGAWTARRRSGRRRWSPTSSRRAPTASR